MNYSDLFYTPQDIARFMFETDLGAQKRGPFVSAVWENERAFVSPQWRKQDFNTFYKTVSRFYDGCMDVEDKKKDINFWKEAGKDNPKINFSENDYINDFSKLKFYFFKALRLKLLFMSEKQTGVYRVEFLAGKAYADLEVLQKCLSFYRLEYYFYSDGEKKTAAFNELLKEARLVYFTLTDGDGIYDDFAEKKAEILENEEVEEEDNEENNDDFEMSWDMYISAFDLLEFFNEFKIKQKGKNNQFQYTQFWVNNCFKYLSSSQPYTHAYMLYDKTKELAKWDYKPNKTRFYLIKQIKLYTTSSGNYYNCQLVDLFNDVGVSGMERPLSLLKKYLDYYGLVVFVGDDEADIEKLGLFQKIKIGDVSFFEGEQE